MLHTYYRRSGSVTQLWMTVSQLPIYKRIKGILSSLGNKVTCVLRVYQVRSFEQSCESCYARNTILLPFCFLLYQRITIIWNKFTHVLRIFFHPAFISKQSYVRIEVSYGWTNFKWSRVHIVCLKQHSFQGLSTFTFGQHLHSFLFRFFPDNIAFCSNNSQQAVVSSVSFFPTLPFNITFHIVLCFLMPQKRNGRCQLTHPFGRVSLWSNFLCSLVHQYAPCVSVYGCMSQKLWYLQPENLYIRLRRPLDSGKFWVLMSLSQSMHTQLLQLFFILKACSQPFM